MRHAPPPSKSSRSRFPRTQPSERPTSGPPLSQDSRLPVSCPSPLPAPGSCDSGKMADGGGSGEAAAARASPAPVPGLNPTLGWRERLRAGLAGTGVSVWLVAGLGLLYALRIPLRLCENLAAVDCQACCLYRLLPRTLKVRPFSYVLVFPWKSHLTSYKLQVLGQKGAFSD